MGEGGRGSRRRWAKQGQGDRDGGGGRDMDRGRERSGMVSRDWGCGSWGRGKDRGREEGRTEARVGELRQGVR